jgi:hypothetical protein
VTATDLVSDDVRDLWATASGSAADRASRTMTAAQAPNVRTCRIADASILTIGTIVIA